MPFFLRKKEKIVALLDEAKLFLQGGENMIFSDYSSLRAKIVWLELKEAVETLSSIFRDNDEATSVSLFKEHCKDRAERNANTCLNYSAMPQGTCNQLYSQLAQLLFEPKTLGELLMILLPEASVIDVDYVVTPKASSSVKRSSLRERTMITFEKKSLECLTEELSLDLLAHLIVVDNTLLDLRAMVSFDFDRHVIFYNKLNEEYPKLARCLYQRNFALRALRNELLTVSGSGRPPGQIIQSFINELTLGGQKFTGAVYARNEAMVAFTEFKSYLESLPEVTKIKLLKLNDTGGTLSSVIGFLNGGNCVEAAAGRLRSIVENKANQDVLNTPPSLSSAELKFLKKKYSHDHPLPTLVDDSLTNLPAVYVDKTFGEVQIKTAHDYLSFILSFPVEFYSILLQKAVFSRDILPNALAEMIKQGVLNQEQREGFSEAVLVARERMGFGAIVRFAVLSNQADLIIKLLQSFSSEARLDLVEPYLFYVSSQNVKLIQPIFDLLSEGDRLEAIKINFDGSSVLHQVARLNAELFLTLLESLPQHARFAALQQEERFGYVLVSIVGNNAKCMIAILKLLPDEARSKVVMMEASDRQPILYHACKNTELLHLMLDLLPEKDRLPVVKSPNQYGGTVLHAAAKNAGSMRLILEMYPEKERRAALDGVHEENGISRTVVRIAGRDPECMIEILKLLPSGQRLEVMLAETEMSSINDGERALDKACENPIFLKNMLDLLSEEDQYIAVRTKNKADVTVLFAAAQNAASVKLILNSYPEKERLQVIKDSKIGSRTLLHAAKDLMVLKMILELYPEPERFAAIQNKGYSLLHSNAVIENPDAIRFILGMYPEGDRLAALKQQRRHGFSFSTDMREVSCYPKSIKVILELLPERDRCKVLMKKGFVLPQPVLHYVIFHHRYELETIKSILELLPVEERLTALIQKNERQDTVFHLVTSMDFFEMLLKFLPEKDRLIALMAKNEWRDETIIQRIVKCSREYGTRHGMEWDLRILQLLSADARHEISKTKEMSWFYKQKPRELLVLYSNGAANPNRSAFIEERLLSLIGDKENRQEAWCVLLSILAKENNLTYDPAWNVAKAAGDEGGQVIGASTLLLMVYFQSATPDSSSSSFRQNLVKSLLIEHASQGVIHEKKSDKDPREDYLALAIIADQEGNTKDKETYLRKFNPSVSRSIFSSPKQSNQEILRDLIKKNPGVVLLVEMYSKEVFHLFGELDPIQSFKFDTDSDSFFPL